MNARGLGEARRLYRARRFSDVIRLLEPEVFRYRENVEYFMLLGFSCLYAGDLGGALSYISRAGQLKDDDLAVKLGLAAIHFRKAEHENAIKRWLEVLAVEPQHRVARRGLELVRRGLTADAVQEMVETGKIRQLYPALPGRVRALPVIAAGIGVIAVAAAAYLVVTNLPTKEPTRPGISGIEIPPDSGRLTDDGTGAVFTLTEAQVRTEFGKAKTQLLRWHDNLAAVSINRILLSNAAAQVKERARLLKGFITPATFDTLQDGFPYASVAAQPALYDLCSVRWSGKIANLKVGKTAITFDLLVGYDQEKELQGIVPVTLGFAAELDDGAPVDLLAQVVAPGPSATGAVAAGPAFGLAGVSVHRLATP